MRIAALLLSALLCACSSAPRREPEPLVDPASVAGSFLARQEITAVFGGREHRFEAALQKDGGTLTVIGLTPFGTKAFVLVQEGMEVRFENLMPKGRQIPLKPNYLLADIHHAFLIRGTPGEWAESAGGEELFEESKGDLLLRRDFRRADEQDGPRVRVDYEGTVGAGFPRSVRLDNGYYGYSLRIETVSHQLLD